MIGEKMKENNDIYGVDIQRYDYMLKKAEDLGLKVTVKYEGFELYRGSKFYGIFYTVNCLLYYLDGFDVGKSEGRFEAFREECERQNTGEKRNEKI